MDKDYEPIVKATREFKSRLNDVLSEALNKFKRDSGGYCVASITIPLIDVTPISSRTKDYVLGDITIRVDFL